MKKVPTIEVKRCFVTAGVMRPPRLGGRYVGTFPQEEFAARLRAAKKKVRAYSKRKLDSVIAAEYKRRLNEYDKTAWYVTKMSLKDLGVWRRAGELPLPWTQGSVVDTARAVRQHMPPEAPLRVFAKVVGKTQREKYLLPIVFRHKTGTPTRRGLPRVLKGDVDDGCMRSVALALSGRKKIRVYFGVPPPEK